MNPLVKKHGLSMGLFYGTLSILYAVYAYVFDASAQTNIWYGLAFFALSVIIYGYGVVKVKREMGGFISFKNAFSTFMISAIVATAMSVVFSILLMNVIDPEYAETVVNAIKEMTLTRLESANLPEEKIQEIMGNLDENNPFAVGSLLKNFFVGVAFSAIIGLLVAAALKKDEPVL
jgi:hypothetical protein